MAPPILDVADDLYGLPATDFVAARNARAAAVRKEGDRVLATAVRGLSKPSAGAAIVNALQRTDGEGIERLIELGRRYREGGSGLDRASLAALDRDRRTRIAELLDHARRTAAESGRALAAAVESEVEQTLRAVVADEGAAAAVLTGRLVRALRSDGIEEVDVDGAVGGPGPDGSPVSAAESGSKANSGVKSKSGSLPRKDKSGSGEDARSRRDREREAARRADAERTLEEATSAWGDAEAAREALEDQLDGLHTAHEEAQSERQRLADALAVADAELKRMAAEDEHLQDEVKQVGRRVRAAHRSVDEAKEALDGLG